MKRFYWSIVMLFSIQALALAQEPVTGEPSRPQKPNPAREVLARDVGTWDCDVKMYMRGPNNPPREHKGVETNDLVSGGKYLRTVFTYKMGNRDYEGHGLMGFDPRSKKYVGTWVDNFSNAPDQFKAEYDEKTKTMTVLSTSVDGGGNEMKTKKITTWTDESTKKLEIYMIVEEAGKQSDIKLMEILSTKRK